MLFSVSFSFFFVLIWKADQVKMKSIFPTQDGFHASSDKIHSQGLFFKAVVNVGSKQTPLARG